MLRVLHQTATVRPGGKLEIVSEELEVGQTVDVLVLHGSGVTEGRSIMEILNSGPQRLPPRPRPAYRRPGRSSGRVVVGAELQRLVVRDDHRAPSPDGGAGDL